MSTAKRKNRKTTKRGHFWGWVIGCSLVAALCLLITLGEKMSDPILPTWQEIFQAVGLAEPQPLDSEMQVHVIDVGNADSILVRNRGANLLIDAGEKGDGDTIVSYLRERGVNKLDAVIATHADADHIGGMTAVLGEFEVGRFYMAFMPEEATPTTQVYAAMLQALTEQNIEVIEAKPGQQFSIGDAKVDILGPAAEFEENNNQSVVCKVTFGSRRFLFVGDAEKEAEDALMTSGADLSADVIKLGHHGSRSSSQPAFLDRVQARYAVITCGAGNSYGHPHTETLETLREREMTVYRSDLCGSIVATTDGSSLSFSTEKE